MKADLKRLINTSSHSIITCDADGGVDAIQDEENDMSEVKVQDLNVCWRSFNVSCQGYERQRNLKIIGVLHSNRYLC